MSNLDSILSIRKINSFVQKNTGFQVSSSFNYNKANWNLFKSELRNFAVNFKTSNDIDVDSDKLTECINEAAQKAIPKRIKFNSNILPAFIINLIKIKRKLKRNIQKFNQRNDKIKYYALNQVIKDEISLFKSEQWNSFLNSIGKNPVSSIPFWKRINKLRNKPESKAIPTLISNNKIYDSATEKANLFAENLASTLNEQHNSTNSFNQKHKLKIDQFVINNEFSNQNLNESKIDNVFSISELKTEIKRLNNKPSLDQFGISNIMLKNLPKEFALLLLNIFNLTINENKIPESWTDLYFFKAYLYEKL